MTRYITAALFQYGKAKRFALLKGIKDLSGLESNCMDHFFSEDMIRQRKGRNIHVSFKHSRAAICCNLFSITIVIAMHLFSEVPN